MLEGGSPPKGMLILGAASTFVVEAVELAEACGLSIAGIVDNLPRGKGRVPTFDYPLYYLSELPGDLRSLRAICCVTTPEYRRRVVTEAMAAGVGQFATLVHPTALVSGRAQLAPGCLVNKRATIDSGSRLQAHVKVGTGAHIAHDNCIEAFASLAIGVVTGGFVRLGEGSYLGLGAIVLPQVTVGRNAVVAAGAVVTEDVPDHCLVAGVPAAVKRTGIPGYRGA